MSDNNPATVHEEDHTGPIKTPKQLLVVVCLSFVVPVLIIMGLVSYVLSGNKPAAGAGDPEKAVAQRIQKIGVVAIRDANSPPQADSDVYAAQAPPAAAPSAVPVVATTATSIQAGAGEALYKQACVACHAASVAGSPKFGDKVAWAPRIKTGIDAMTASVIKGKGIMPPKGGSSASDANIRAAVEFMASAAK